MIDLPLFPIEASTVAWQVDLLLAVLVGLSGTFTLLVVILIIYFSIKYRRGAQVDRSRPPEGNTKLEFVWIFGLLTLSVGTFIWATVLYFRMLTPPRDALEISVVAQQWMWKFQHPEGQREIDRLHVPIGRPIRLVMTSQDVIHSFYVPAFRLKYDVLPGRYTSLWFEATKTGEYHLFCAEFCGTNHAQMVGSIIVMEPAQYQEWLSGGGAQPGVSVGQTGEELFNQLGCNGCHAPDSGVRAPSLVGLFGSQVTLESGETVMADENYLRESILLPQSKVVEGYDPIMPTFEGRVTEDQLLQLIAYIKSLEE